MQATKSSDKEILLTRRFAAQRETVFAALTQEEHLARWMMTAEMALIACDVDLRVGGKCRYVYQRPNGRKLEVHGVHESVDPPRGFAYAETYDFSPLKVHVTTTLESADGETIFRQTLRYASKQERDEDFAGVASSSKEAYGRLDKYLPQIEK